MPITDCAIPNLPEELRALLAQVPPGRVTTYGNLARALGSKSAARWVGEFLVNHVHDANCPCHRVIRITGDLGLYISGESNEKCRLLQREAVTVIDGRVDLQQFEFNEFQSARPLIPLIELQNGLPVQVVLKPLPAMPDFVAGVDVSYRAPDRAVAAYALVETATGRLAWSLTLSRRITFPYIPGFLAFREISVLLELIEQVRLQQQLADVLFVDGNGMLHPRRAGVAVHLGVAADLPCIGIGKKLLCGSVDLHEMHPGESRPVTDHDQVVGMAVRSKETSRPVFVSPGQSITLEDSVRLTRLQFHGHRLPEPIYWADKLSRQAAADTD